MRKIVYFAVLAALAWVCLPGSPAQAQNTVANALFSTQDIQHWTTSDPSVKASPGAASLGMDWYCMMKAPGVPYDNGSVTQEVHLVGGVSYHFSANIAAVYSCPG